MNGVAIVGYGYWGPKLTRNFLQNGTFARVVICEEDPARLERGVRENPGAHGSGSYSQVLADSTIEAVALATPVATHHALALAALRAGKHVLVEKPLATSATDAEELICAAAACGRVLMVDHTYVYHPAVQKIRSLVDSGEVGRLNFVDSTRINLGLFQHDVNVFWDLAVHDIAIINFITRDRPHLVQAVGAALPPGPFATIGVLTLRYPSGFFVHVHCSWVAPVKIRHMLIGGDKKMIVYDDLDANESVKIYDSGVLARTDEERNRLLFEYRAGDVYSPRIAPREALANMVADFVKAIDTNTAPLASGRLGADAVRILEAAQRSIDSGGSEAPITWK